MYGILIINVVSKLFLAEDFFFENLAPAFNDYFIRATALNPPPPYFKFIVWFDLRGNECIE